MLITIVHGGQTGVDRGAHEGAIAVGWGVAGYATRDQRDERGQIPQDVRRYLLPHATNNYAARTEANVRLSQALLVIVEGSRAPLTPGTARTLVLATDRKLPRRIAYPDDADYDAIARWIWDNLLRWQAQPLPIEPAAPPSPPPRLMVAGPRESKWPRARIETAKILRHVARALDDISRGAAVPVIAKSTP